MSFDLTSITASCVDFGSSGSGVVREAEPYQVNDEGEEDQNGDRSVFFKDNVINILTQNCLPVQLCGPSLSL